MKEKKEEVKDTSKYYVCALTANLGALNGKPKYVFKAGEKIKLTKDEAKAFSKYIVT